MDEIRIIFISWLSTL